MEVTTTEAEATTVKNEYPSLSEKMGIVKNIEAITEVVKPEVTPAAQVVESTTKPEEKAEPAQPTAINLEELTDEQIVAAIEKKTGKKVNLADFSKPEPKTAEEIAAEKEKKHNAALAWGYENGKIKREEYDNAIIGISKPDRDIALAQFTKEVIAEDKDITPEEAEEMFKDAYHENDPESRLYKVGQKEIKKLADQYRKEVSNPLNEVESEYEEFITLDAQYKDYRSTVKKVASDLPKTLEFKSTYKYLDGPEEEITYNIPVDEKLYNKIISDASSQAAFLNRDGQVDEKQLAKELQHHIKAVMYDVALPLIIKQNTEEVEKRMEVVLGNKRNGAPELNSGRQNTQRAANKTNTYSSLEQAMAGRR